MFAKISAALLLLAHFAAAVPVENALEARAVDTSSHCGQYDSVQAYPYILYLNQWGIGKGISGSDCAHVQSLNKAVISWATTWSWTGGSGIKSYTTIGLQKGVNQPISSIHKIASFWNWQQDKTGVVADVAYDMFTSTSAGGKNVNEIMIWLANFNSGPISFHWTAQGQAIPIATGLSFAGHTWNLYYGNNGSNDVYSFLPTSGTITGFSGDLYTFLQYLTSHGHFSASQYLTVLQAGTEATSGSATFTTNSYSTIIA
ncbi:unnamed protein product [Mycena citricolor]|uniref:Glycoside hydrolase family 12 protein n=1 Tax=Mycena citricolor TaxID=2018698 RepID=A0AAD2HA69_9AGAR|nr:unnamed protein product [Mycena citricolor]CAK5272749.1 unnamed protein product [Mycena citricolor]